MLVINIYGEPSAGKTATMFTLAGKMKRLGLSVEITPEVYKDLVYENSRENQDIHQTAKNTFEQVKKFGGQFSILSEQNKRLARLVGNVDFAITDCPLPLIAFYTPKDYIEGFEQFANNLFKTYNNYNIFLKRNHEFESKARIHDESQAMKIAQEMPAYLEKFIGQHYREVTTSDLVENEIIAFLVKDNMMTLPVSTHLNIKLESSMVDSQSSLEMKG